MDISISALKKGKKSFLTLRIQKTISLLSSHKNIDGKVLIKVIPLNNLNIYHELLFGIALSDADIDNKKIMLYIPIVYRLDGSIEIFIYEYLKVLKYDTQNFIINIRPQDIYFYTREKLDPKMQFSGQDYYIFVVSLDVRELDLKIKNEPYIIQTDILTIKGITKTNGKSYEGMIRGLSVFDSYLQDIYLPCVYKNNELTIYNYNYNPHMHPEFFNLNSQTLYLI